MGYGSYGASEEITTYNQCTASDAYLMVNNVLKGADPNGEIAKSEYLTKALTDKDTPYTSWRESAERAILEAVPHFKDDPVAMERLATIPFVTRAQLGLPQNPDNEKLHQGAGLTAASAIAASKQGR